MPPLPTHNVGNVDPHSGDTHPLLTADIRADAEYGLLIFKRMTEHLRDKGRNEAANQITREITQTFRYLYGVISGLDDDQCFYVHQTAPEVASQRRRSPSDLQPVLEQEHVSRRPSILPVPRSNPSAGSSSSTWAAIAALPSNNVGAAARSEPSNALKRQEGEDELRDFNGGDQRVVWIQGWTAARPLKEITDLTANGALYSMAFSSEEQAACLIFQHATSAKQFLQDHTEYLEQVGECRFGAQCNVVAGCPYPTNRNIRRMEHPYNERRRLTFARQQLFGNGITEEKFRADVERLIERSNVELIWLFNSGNASVVLSAVPLARAVRDHFSALSNQRSSIYYGVMVSFSHDPCERAMHLTSQMPRKVGSSTHFGCKGLFLASAGYSNVAPMSAYIQNLPTDGNARVRQPPGFDPVQPSASRTGRQDMRGTSAAPTSSTVSSSSGATPHNQWKTVVRKR